MNWRNTHVNEHSIQDTFGRLGPSIQFGMKNGAASKSNAEFQSGFRRDNDNNAANDTNNNNGDDNNNLDD